MVLQKRNIKWVVFVLLAIAIIPVVITTYEVIFTENKSVLFLGNYHENLIFLVISYYFLLLALGVFWLVRQIVFISKVKHERKKAELMFLKSQVSPHFFFNILNNLYGMVAKDSQKAQELILKLSDMMRYCIYEGEKETVTVKEEVSFLKNYIELHQMRYHKEINIDFICNVDENRRVLPLLFILLVENAFKHGIENLRQDAYVKMSLITTANEIRFTIENNYEKVESQSGIGLKNLKRRLELIYPNQHKLVFLVTENVYKVQLILTKYD
jgi:two-component system sensor histidine kinase AlgZ